ncbi:MAG: 16S rRNA (uracil(1498)-N(3))-methyltransferase [Myxococcota bacterium]|nr:16S rRNA (uracil(1498)-N(3))-methyltransferase [Myxococcota bacterium]
MNLILLFEEDRIEGGERICLRGRRRQHVLEIHRAQVGDQLRVGLLGGSTGQARVVGLDEEVLEMEVVLDAEPPLPLPVFLVLALPRPPVLRRALISATSMGVKRIVLLNASAVEKSFWQSSALESDALFHQCVLGLEQARDTRPPEILLRSRFRPFVEDELPALVAGGRGWVAEPGPISEAHRMGESPAVLAVGPESGWSAYELASLGRAGLERISLGPRALRVETALPALLGRFL